MRPVRVNDLLEKRDEGVVCLLAEGREGRQATGQRVARGVEGEMIAPGVGLSLEAKRSEARKGFWLDNTTCWSAVMSNPSVGRIPNKDNEDPKFFFLV